MPLTSLSREQTQTKSNLIIVKSSNIFLTPTRHSVFTVLIYLVKRCALSTRGVVDYKFSFSDFGSESNFELNLAPTSSLNSISDSGRKKLVEEANDSIDLSMFGSLIYQI